MIGGVVDGAEGGSDSKQMPANNERTVGSVSKQAAVAESLGEISCFACQAGRVSKHYV